MEGNETLHDYLEQCYGVDVGFSLNSDSDLITDNRVATPRIR